VDRYEEEKSESERKEEDGGKVEGKGGRRRKEQEGGGRREEEDGGRRTETGRREEGDERGGREELRSFFSFRPCTRLIFFQIDVVSYNDFPATGKSLPRPRTWLKRPSTVSFAFGGQLVSVPMQKAGEPSKVEVRTTFFFKEREEGGKK
jgi:hypothetical protein